MSKVKQNRKPTVLVGLIIVSAVIIAFVGFILRIKLAPQSVTYRDASIMEVPFLLMKNPDDMKLLSSKEIPTEPSTEPSAEPSTEAPTEPSTAVTEPSDPDTTDETAPSEPEVTEEVPQVTKAPYVPSSGPCAVWGEDESFFDDALFVGDSRMVGIASYARLGKADYFADVGLNVFTTLTKTASDETFSNWYLTDLLGQRDYTKVFIMLGINECGYDHGTVASKYQDIIDKILAYEEDAKVYILSVYGTSRAKEQYGSYFGPGSLSDLNDRLEELADGEQVFFLDCRYLFEDSQGYILDDITGDGVHLYGKYADMLPKWLCEQDLS